MKLEELEERKKALIEGRDSLSANIKQLEANIYATNGAISELDYWIAIVSAKENVEV
jgi:hypothetical protein